MIVGGKSQYVSLLSLIKNESKALYKIVDDLCLDQMFRSQKYKNTFLMPNDTLVKHISDLVEKDDDIKAIDLIRSLFLKGHYQPKDFTKGAKIGTLQYTPSVLSQPEEVAKHIKASQKTIIATREGAHATVVYQYDSKVAPATGAGVTGGLELVGTISGGELNDARHKAFKDLTKKMMDSKDPSKIVDRFHAAVHKLLVKIESDKEKVERVKYYLSYNVILSWFLLTMPSKNDPVIKLDEDEIKNFPVDDMAPSNSLWNKFKNEPVDNVKILADNKKHRGDCINAGKPIMLSKIKECYQDHLKHETIARAYPGQNGANLKMLVDELRYTYGDIKYISNIEHIDDMVHSLLRIDWNEPSRYLCVCCPSTQTDLKLCPEVFLSGPMCFVKSLYFLYVPVTKSQEESLMKQIDGGSISGGNPAEIRSVIFTGGSLSAHTNATTVAHASRMEQFLGGLSAEERAQLKEMLH